MEGFPADLKACKTMSSRAESRLLLSLATLTCKAKIPVESFKTKLWSPERNVRPWEIPGSCSVTCCWLGPTGKSNTIEQSKTGSCLKPKQQKQSHFKTVEESTHGPSEIPPVLTWRCTALWLRWAELCTCMWQAYTSSLCLSQEGRFAFPPAPCCTPVRHSGYRDLNEAEGNSNCSREML